MFKPLTPHAWGPLRQQPQLQAMCGYVLRMQIFPLVQMAKQVAFLVSRGLCVASLHHCNGHFPSHGSRDFVTLLRPLCLQTWAAQLTACCLCCAEPLQAHCKKVQGHALRGTVGACRSSL